MMGSLRGMMTMYVENIQGGELTAQERRDAAQNERRALGNVVRCDGARAVFRA